MIGLERLSQQVGQWQTQGSGTCLHDADATCGCHRGNAEYTTSTSSWSGCGEQGFSYAYGALAEPEAAAFDYIVQSVAGVVPPFDSTLRGVELLQAWSLCMSKIGCKFANPLEADNKFDSAPSIGAEELRTREADLNCDCETKLTEGRSAFERALFDAWLDDNSEIIKEYEQKLAAAKRQVVKRSASLREDGVAALST